MATVKDNDYKDQGRNFQVNEGMFIGGQEPQALGVETKKLIAGETLAKGNCVGMITPGATHPWKVGYNSNSFIGVVCNKAKTGEEVVVQTRGLVKLIAGGSIEQGDLVCMSATKVITTTTIDKKFVGRAISTASSGEEVYVLLGL